MTSGKEIVIEVQEDREMTNAEVETVASLLFRWWKKEFETEHREDNRNEKEK